MKKIRKSISIAMINLLFCQSLSFAKSQKNQYDLRNLALPSDVKGIRKDAGAVYYSSSVKGKVLIPVHVWGEVNRAGLHFVPIDTTLVSGLSLAGGPTTQASLEDIKLIRNAKKEIVDYEFDLSEGGDPEAYSTALKPGDSIFVSKERFYEDRSYYTSLTSVIVTILSSILLFREVRKSS